MKKARRILQLLIDGVADGVFPGAVLLVSQKKKTIFFEAVGNGALVPTPRPMTLDTRFDLGDWMVPSWSFCPPLVSRKISRKSPSDSCSATALAYPLGSHTIFL
jgi:hypothetical protein